MRWWAGSMGWGSGSTGFLETVVLLVLCSDARCLLLVSVPEDAWVPYLVRIENCKVKCLFVRVLSELCVW